MAIGKLSHEQLQRLVLDALSAGPGMGPGVGEDCAEWPLDGQTLVLSTDPVTAGGRYAAALCVHVNANDLGAAGVRPLAMMLTLLCPPGMPEEAIAELMRQAQAAAETVGLTIAGGHTEWTDAVTRPVLSATVVGVLPAGQAPLRTSGMCPGDALVLTKAAGLEGTAILAAERGHALAKRLPLETVRRAQGFLADISVVPEGLLAARTPGTHALHDVTEGGVAGAAWEMAAASGCGVQLRRGDVPVRPETTAICKVFGIDPLRLIGSGSMLCATEQPETLLAALSQAGIPAAVIGRALPAAEGICDEGGTPLPPPGRDALYDALAVAL